MNKFISLPVVLFWAFFTAKLCSGGEVENKFINAGLVDVQTIDNSIKVDLVNSDPSKNFFRENYYGNLSKAYLREEVARKLAHAQQILKGKYSNYSLQILDAARPRSISQKMYEKIKGTKFEKYVANPQKGSMHNYGISVDITIVDENEKEIDMGFSPFRKSTPNLIWQFAKMKIGIKLSENQKKNRELLNSVMTQAGFLPLSFEWWHFNGLDKHLARGKYSIIE
ncbi:MAG: M15 family metallopeptidase [Desulfobulbaceae bacterium]|nr:M15 family metallopeptidase [Desulfobulbaceae bacterium]